MELETTWFKNSLSANLNLFYIFNKSGIYITEDNQGNRLIPEKAKSKHSRGYYYILSEYEKRKRIELFIQGNTTKSWTLLSSYAFCDRVIKAKENTFLGGSERYGQPKQSYSVWSKYEIY